MVATPSGKLLSFRLDDASDAPNPVSEAALALANGSHTVRQIAEAIAARFDVTEEQAAADLLNFFEQLISADAFERRR